MTRHPKPTPSFTTIYFLLTHPHISHFHTIHPHQLSYYHAPHTFNIHIITPKPQYHTLKLPTHIHSPDSLQYSLPKPTIFPSTLDSPHGYTLVPCMSQPRFQYHHF
ncbi:cupin domain-containing protein, partial [Staphylococcus epidermidis]|uniref:cupin domain-containing protein n=1 Tax=Staphylococcus epidermidis TaxID=1282 RepID=UPI0037D9E1CD